MAEVPSAAGAKKTSVSSFFAGKKRIPAMTFYVFLFGAIVVDVLLSDWLPFSGTAFVFCLRAIYWLNGYKTDKMFLTTIVTEIVGIFPVAADVTNIVFVVVTYLINIAETNKDKALLGKQIAQRTNAGKKYQAYKAKKSAQMSNSQPSAGGNRNVDGVSGKNSSSERPRTLDLKRGSYAARRQRQQKPVEDSGASEEFDIAA